MTAAASPQPAALRLPDLTLARGDTSTLSRVLLLHRRRLLRAFLTFPKPVIAARLRPLHGAAAKVLKATARADVNAALGLIGEPTINVLATLCAREVSQAPSAEQRANFNLWLEELCLLVLLQQAVAGRLPTPIRWRLRVGGPALLSISANLELRAIDAAVDVTLVSNAVRVGSETIDLRDTTKPLPTVPGARIRRPYTPIIDGVFLAETDNNPLSDFEAHPDKDGNQLDLGGHPASQWARVIAACFELVDEHLPLLAQELRMVARIVIPVGFDAEKHLSASYKECIGAAYMTLHPNVMTMAEALIHEFQHNKLNAAAHLDPMLHNAFWPLFTSPVRPDPRPLWGVVLAVHAFQPVAALYRAMHEAGHAWAANPSWQRRWRAVLAKNHDGATTVLDNAECTDLGGELLAEMRQLDGESSKWMQGGPA